VKSVVDFFWREPGPRSGREQKKWLTTDFPGRQSRNQKALTKGNEGNEVSEKSSRKCVNFTYSGTDFTDKEKQKT
jgi:hypothetical protein